MDRGVGKKEGARGKKSSENIWRGGKKVFIFAPALRERRRLKPRDFDQSDEVLRRFDKIFRKDLEDSKKVVTFAARKEVRDDREARERVLKVSDRKKIFQKDLEVSKKALTFAPLSAEKTAVSPGAKRSDQNPDKTKKVFL